MIGWRGDPASIINFLSNEEPCVFRKVLHSSSLAGIFDLPPVFKNRKVEVIMFPVEETADTIPKFTRAQIEEWSKSPKVQALVGVLAGTGLPEDISMKDIRQMRLAEKYQI